jgi:hypothetical protein
VVERRQGRPLTPRRDIGTAEIGDDIDPGEARQQCPVADLPSAPLDRAVQDRVAVEADELDRYTGMARAKFGDGGGVTPGQLGLNRLDIRSRAGPAQHRTKPVAEGLGIGDGQGWARDDAAAAVGRDRRDIDAVKRGAAHQAQRVPQFCAR